MDLEYMLIRYLLVPAAQPDAGTSLFLAGGSETAAAAAFPEHFFWHSLLSFQCLLIHMVQKISFVYTYKNPASVSLFISHPFFLG